MARISALLTALLSVTLTVHAFPTSNSSRHSSWPGWAGIKYWFVFGDSYSTTGFDINGQQPCPANPLGNPPYPGNTSSNGPNWVDYLTTTHNTTQLLTYNLASGGATLDAAIVPQYLPSIRSVKHQIQQQFLANYTGTPRAPAFWSSTNTLFSVWVGTNDVGMSYTTHNESLYDSIFAEFRALLDQLHATGARNLLLLTVPPVHRAPLTASRGAAPIAHEARAIRAWNARVAQLARSTRAAHRDAAVFVVDAYALFEGVLDAPGRFAQTRQLVEVSGFCGAYESGTPAKDSFLPACGVPVNQYFWLNSLHPTYPMHEVLAARVATTLKECEAGAWPKDVGFQ
ncbi:carbohydrate esterase family 16 protein [Aplosporella prunicola CBS 121167]|uniref:Carbohydrate esterase family 16 protein n=1 Tax=Aplosporella prunicola CBS 121167 TaxID=1176127 RepID=A0A6A6B6T1_9PEZI|nr:carbohydrate esterase family 16 protein [Aplosporella prunicola CBS 121167]KAF2138501.1 carbohydrate esterase family 16 protein [Aplosporella prunicola CBS 121167]